MTTEKTIYLFGDSYFDTELCLKKHKYECRNIWDLWTVRLEKTFENDYKFENFSKSGAGPHYTFKIFDRLLHDEKFTKKDIIIFHLSGAERIDFIHKDESVQMNLCNIGWDSSRRASYCTFNEYSQKDLKVEQQKVLDYYNDFRSEIDFLYLTLDKYLESSNFKNVSYLYVLSKILKFKIIVFLPEINNIIFNSMLSLNDENFFLSKYDLFNVSAMEVFDNQLEEIIGHLKTCKRGMHLSKENHNIMFEYICKIIENDYDNLPIFKSNFRNYDEVYHVISKKLPQLREKFIYD